jgi:hypothetical protein
MIVSVVLYLNVLYMLKGAGSHPHQPADPLLARVMVIMGIVDIPRNSLALFCTSPYNAPHSDCSGIFTVQAGFSEIVSIMRKAL